MDTKKIIIIGKNACEGMNVKKEDRVRAGWEEKRELSIEQALSSLLSIDTNKEEYYSRDFRRELEKKINGYKQQDIKKKIHNDSTLINLEDTVSKLVACGLKCYYCEKRVKVMYRKVRDKYQWTLDRIDNDKNHSNNNTVISCLSCNLARRRRSKQAYEFHWKTKIIKVDREIIESDNQDNSDEDNSDEVDSN